jgi:predicted GNAT family N-acyltransferase
MIELQDEFYPLLKQRMDEWSVKLDRLLERSDEKTEIGRLLVEEKARNLELQRQLHRAEHSLDEKRQALRSLLELEQQLVNKLARSTGFRMLSPFTSKPRRTVERTQRLLEQMKLILNRE